MIKVIVLDFDGVIVESVNIKTEAFRELFQEYKDQINDIIKYHLDNNAISRYIKFKYIYENILGKDYNEETEKKLGEKFSDIVFQKVIECDFVKGAPEFLRYFSKSIPIYLASNTPQNELEKIVEKKSIKNYFKHIFGSPPGNKIDFIKKAMKIEKVNSNEVLYIGDMIEDYNIAKKAGVNFVGRRNVENFDDFDIPQFSDLIKIKEYIISISS